MNYKRTERIDQLFRAVLSLQSLEECYQCFEDLCTVKELQAIAQRLEVAYMLSEGMSYQQTIERTGASSATISRVKRSLEYGAGGYELVLKRIANQEQSDAHS